MPKSITDQIGEVKDVIRTLAAEAKAIMLKIEEGAELTDDENARLDELTGTVGEEDSGLIGQAEARLASLNDLEEKRTKLYAIADPSGRQAVGSALAETVSIRDGQHPLGATRAVIVPRAAKRHRPLKHFETEAEAYAAGQWLLAVLTGRPDSMAWCRDHGILAQQQVGDNPKGGYLVPSELERAIIDIREGYGIARRDCRIYPMSTNTLDVPKVATGLTASPAGELSDLFANNLTEKTWEQINLIARKWATYSYFSTEIAEDAIVDIAMDLARDIARAMAYSEDDSTFNGDGGAGYNQITGIKNALLAGSVYTATGKTAFSALEIGDFEAMIGLLPNVAGLDPKWYIHKSAWAVSMQKILDAGGGNTISSLEMGARLADGDFMFLGYPGRWLNVGLSTANEGTGVAGACYFGDLRMGVAFGDRRGVTVGLSEHRHFELDAWAIRGTERFDVQVHETGTASVSGTIASMTFG